MLTIAELTMEYANAAAEIHRAAGALIPGYDTSLHSADEFVKFYHEDVMQKDKLWGAFEGEVLRGFICIVAVLDRPPVRNTRAA